MICIFYDPHIAQWVCSLRRDDDAYYGISAKDALLEFLAGYAARALQDHPDVRHRAQDVFEEEDAE